MNLKMNPQKEMKMQYIITKEELASMVDQEVVKIIDGKIDAIHEMVVDKAAQWLYDHLTSEYQGAVLKIVAKDKGKMPVEFVEEFKKAMME